MKKVMMLMCLLIGLIAGLSSFSSNKQIECGQKNDYCLHSLGDVCSCGGELQYTSKAYAVKKKCPSCDGKGKLRSGVDKNGKTYYEKCTTCNGIGYWLDWQSGYKCQRCGKVVAN